MGVKERRPYKCQAQVEVNGGETQTCNSTEFESNGFQAFCARCGKAAPRGSVFA